MFVKFMHSADVDKFLGGSVLFRQLRYYRILEVALADRRIGDRSEGVSQRTEQYLLANVDLGPERFHIDFDAATGALSVTGGSPATIRADIVDCYAFCLSNGELDSLWPIMCREADDAPYDAAIEILDPIRFAKHLYFYGELHIDGQPPVYVRNLFKIEWGKVQYRSGADRRHGLPISERVPLVGGGTPFIKSTDYQEQCEWRILLHPTTEVLDYCTLRLVVPDLKCFIAIRRRSHVSSDTLANDLTKEILDFKAILSDLSSDGIADKISESAEFRSDTFRKIARVCLAAYKADN